MRLHRPFVVEGYGDFELFDVGASVVVVPVAVAAVVKT